MGVFFEIKIYFINLIITNIDYLIFDQIKKFRLKRNCILKVMNFFEIFLEFF